MNDKLRSALDAGVTAACGTETRITDLIPLTGDASSRSYVRLQLAGPGPQTAVAMLLAGSGLALSSDELGVFAAPPKELPYLNLHAFLEPLGVRVPRVYFDGQSDGFILLEDIGDVALRDAAAGLPAAEVQRLYQRAIDQLVLLQVDGTRRRNGRCIAFQQRFDKRLFLWEFEHFIEWGLEKRTGTSLSATEGTELRAAFERIASRLDRAPAFLNHRDYHSWNLFVHAGEIRVIDFQDALLAPASYDLETLLNDRDTPMVITPELEHTLVEYYRAAWHGHGGPALSRDTLWEEYNLCLLQKASKVVGRFFFLALEKGKPGYLRYIPPTLATLRRVLDRLPDYRRLEQILADRFGAEFPG